jgi:hypothetical protein
VNCPSRCLYSPVRCKHRQQGEVPDFGHFIPDLPGCIGLMANTREKLTSNGDKIFPYFSSIRTKRNKMCTHKRATRHLIHKLINAESSFNVVVYISSHAKRITSFLETYNCLTCHFFFKNHHVQIYDQCLISLSAACLLLARFLICLYFGPKNGEHISSEISVEFCLTTRIGR